MSLLLMKSSASSGRSSRPLLLTITLSLLLSACTKKDNPVGPDATPLSGKISTDSPINVSSTSIGSMGGEIAVTEPGSPLNGLRLTVPSNGYSRDKVFRISYAKIRSHEFGQDFNPISPVITVANGGGYSDMPMTLKIPVKVAAGYFAMGFFYDRASGELEGLPLLDTDSTSVTIATRHFMRSALSPANGLARSGGGLSRPWDEDVSYSDIVVTQISEPQLDLVKSTNFQPGVDDWQFPNYGSFVSRGGHCAGQSMAMVWYCNFKKAKGSPSLWGRFDNNGSSPSTPSLWQDDVLGYKFCSTLQEDMDWNSYSRRLLSGFQQRGGAWPVAKRTMWLFCYALRLTGKPQLMFVAGRDGAHAMVVYGVDHEKLLIADPNRPGNTKLAVVYRNGIFDPFWTGNNAGSLDILFDTFEYFGLTAVLDYSKIDARWAEVANKSIGSDRFPLDTVKVVTDSSRIVILSDGFKKEDGWFTLSVGASGFLPSFQVFDAAGTFLMQDYKFHLAAGTHRIGVCVTDTGKHWVNFHWYSLEAGKGGLDLVALKSLSIVLTAKLKNASGQSRTVSPIDAHVSNVPPDSVSERFAAITWAGTSLRVDYRYTRKWASGSTTVTTGNVLGEFQSDGTKMIRLQGTDTEDYRSAQMVSRRTFAVDLRNVPMFISGSDPYYSTGDKASIQSVLTSLSYTTYDSSSVVTEKSYNVVDWNSDVYLEARFSTRTY